MVWNPTFPFSPFSDLTGSRPNPSFFVFLFGARIEPIWISFLFGFDSDWDEGVRVPNLFPSPSCFGINPIWDGLQIRVSVSFSFDFFSFSEFIRISSLLPLFFLRFGLISVFRTEGGD